MKLNKYFIAVLLVLILFLGINSVFATDNVSQDANLDSFSNNNFIMSNSYGSGSLDAGSVGSGSGSLDNNSVDNSNINDNSKTIYISPNGTGNGLSYDDPSNWSQAEKFVNNKLINEVIFTDGTYYINNIKFNNVGNLTLKALNNQKVTIDCQNNLFMSFGFNNLTLIGLNLYNLKGLIGNGIFIGNYLNFVNTSSYNNGGAISAFNSVILNNSNFTNSYSHRNGGAIYARGYFNGTNLNFINVSSNYAGGAIYGGYIFLNNSNFTDTYADEGGAIYSLKRINGSNLNFINSGASTKAGSVYSLGNISFTNISIFNSHSIWDNWSYVGGILANNYFIGNNLIIINTKSRDSGGAISAGFNMLLNNITIINSTSKRYGGAINVNRNLTVYNLTINNTESYDDGGAINAGNIVLNNASITNTHTYGSDNLGKGGAIATNNLVGNNLNIVNSSSTNSGGAINANNVNLTNSTVINSSAVNNGGAIQTVNLYINNSLISNSIAKIGGGIYASNSNINNLSFINNIGINGGVIFSFNGNITNSTFVSNNAYDGAVIDCNNLTFNSNDLVNNTAKTYGLIYSINATINNNTFTDNRALNNILVHVLNNLNTDNVSYIVKPNSTRVLINSNNINSSTGLIDLGNGLYGLFTQKTLNQPSEVYLINDTNWVHNQLGGGDVSVYIKLLLLKYGKTNINLQDIAYIFTDGDYRNSDNPIVKDILGLYDSNRKIMYYDNVYYRLSNGTFRVIDHEVTGGNANYKNIIAFKFAYVNMVYNITVNMTPLNKTVLKGNDAVFNITINNTGNDYLYGLNIVEDDFNGLKFNRSVFNSSWTKSINSDGKLVWTYNGRLDPNETLSILVYFNTNSTGNFTNHIIVNSDEISNKTVDAGVEVLEGNYTVNVTNSTVLINNKTSIIINIYNNGSAVLHNISIVSVDSIGLKYDSFIGNNWTYSNDDGKNIWTYHGSLNPKNTLKLTVFYKAVKIGNYTLLYNISTDEGLNTTIDTNVNVYKNNLNNKFNVNKIKSNNNIDNNMNIDNINSNIRIGDVNNYTLPETGLPILLFVVVVIILCIVVIYRRNQN